MSHAIAPPTQATTMRRLAALSLGGVALYVLLDVLLFFLRPDLPILRHAESDYGNGPWAWIMDLNFVLRCVFSLIALAALAYALPRSGAKWLALTLLGLWAVASGVLAFFSDDYEGAPATPHGEIHLVAAGVGFLCCLVATLLLTGMLARLWRGQPIAAALIACWIVAALGFFLLFFLGFRHSGLDGLYERIFLGFELLWIALAMWRIARYDAPGQAT